MDFIVADAVTGIVERLVRSLAKPEQPVALSHLCRAFLSETDMSLTSACGMRPAEFLAQFPGRLVLQDGFVQVVEPPPTDRADGQLPAELLLAVAPGSDALPRQVAECVERQLCMDVLVQLGGSVGRGTHTSRCQDVDLLLSFRCDSVDARRFQEMQGPLQRTLEHLLRHLEVELDGERRPCSTDVDPRGFLLLRCGGFNLRVLLAPQLNSTEARSLDRRLDGLGSVPTALEAPLVTWVRAQPAHVLNHIRVVKHWASSFRWSSAYLAPPPLLLELVVIHTAQTKEGTLLAAVFSRLADAENAYVAWEAKGRICATTFEPPHGARPVVLDPFRGSAVNHAGPDRFDASELQAKARDFVRADPRQQLRQLGVTADKILDADATPGATPDAKPGATPDAKPSPKAASIGSATTAEQLAGEPDDTSDTQSDASFVSLDSPR